MSKELERDLGLLAVVAISMGAMIGSGIFILPGLAMAEGGPAVIVAFIIAGILVFPAAVSIAELGTAMPEAGGDYIFIERGIGPGAGTIAGLGTWLLLMFKGALALVGGMFYLEVLIALPSVVAAAIVVGTILILVNIIGVKQTGGLQVFMVVIMIVILAAFVVLTITRVEAHHYQPFYAEGIGGLLSATAMVLVSYAGVTKVAAAAEEIENPGRNLPLGLLISLFATTLLYALIVFVLVGTIDGEALMGSTIPMVIAVEPLLGFFGVLAIVLAAMLALISTANAGILTASRYPLALSRDNLLPHVFEYIHDNFRTPVVAILTTGLAMLVIIVFLPVEDIAKTAGAFQIVVYILVNLALIAFRERNVEWYDPSFRSPGYPWVQLFGVLSGIFIITQMDLLPIVGGVGIVILGAIWYKWYASRRVDREGLAVDVVRRETGRQFVAETREQLQDQAGGPILIAIRQDAGLLEENRLLELIGPIAERRESYIRIVRFDEVPDQFPLEDAAMVETPADIEFERRSDELAQNIEVPVEVGEIVTHDTRRAVVNLAARIDAEMIVTRSDPVSRLRTLFGGDSDWILDHAPCDVVFIQPGIIDGVEDIAIVTDRSPFNDPLKVRIADSIATRTGASIRFLYTVAPDSSDRLIETIQDYHQRLDDLCSAPVESHIIRTDQNVKALVDGLADADLVVLSTTTHRLIPHLLFTRREDRIAARLDQPVILVHSKKVGRTSFLEPIMDRILFRKQPDE